MPIRRAVPAMASSTCRALTPRLALLERAPGAARGRFSAQLLPQRNFLSVCGARALSRSAHPGVSLFQHRSLFALVAGGPSSAQRSRSSPRSPRGTRGLFITTQDTPNPMSLKFVPADKTILEAGTAQFSSVKEAQRSPLARGLFRIEGVVNVFLAKNFLSVTIGEAQVWSEMKPHIFSAITDFFNSGEPAMADSESLAHDDTVIRDDDDEVVAMIKELIDTRIRPSIQEDGGDLVYRGFDAERGVVKLQLQGSCVGCPSSSVTLKSGILRMMQYYIPEVTEVEEIADHSLLKARQEAKSRLEQFQEQLREKRAQLEKAQNEKEAQDGQQAQAEEDPKQEGGQK